MGSTKVTAIDADRSALMKRVKQRGTDPELRVRGLLTRLGARYRVNVKNLPGSPDIASKTRKKAIFVHGCYWHAHQNCSKHRLPKHNRDFWREKFKANIERDKRKVDALEARGFDVKVVWQCELNDSDRLEQSLRNFWFGSESETG